jgi:hypothetical protein
LNCGRCAETNATVDAARSAAAARVVIMRPDYSAALEVRREGVSAS